MCDAVVHPTSDAEEIDCKPQKKQNIGKRKFKSYWLEDFEWLEEGPSVTSNAQCKYCNVSLPLKRYGFVMHESTTKHAKMETAYLADKEESIKFSNQCLELQLDESIESGLVSDSETKSKMQTPNKSGCQSKPTSRRLLRKSSPRVMKTVRSKESTNSESETFSYCIIQSNSKIVGLASQIPPDVLATSKSVEEGFTLSEAEILNIVNGVSNRFSIDLKTLLLRNRPLLDQITKDSEFIKGKQGTFRLKKMLVGHLAQQYLSESTVALFRHGEEESTEEQNDIRSKLEEITQKVDTTVHELQMMKALLKEQEKAHLVIDEDHLG